MKSLHADGRPNGREYEHHDTNNQRGGPQRPPLRQRVNGGEEHIHDAEERSDSCDSAPDGSSHEYGELFASLDLREPDFSADHPLKVVRDVAENAYD